MMITKDEAKDLFGPIQSDLNRMILESWEKIHKSDLNFKSRSRASLMWDETLSLANITWCESDHIYKIEEKKSQTAHYWLDSHTFFRIKKGDGKGYTRNYPTQAAWEFHAPQSELFARANRLEVTYVLSADESSIIDIAVVHRAGNQIDFRFSLLDSQNIERLPLPNSDHNNQSQNGSVAKLKSELDNKLTMKDQEK